MAKDMTEKNISNLDPLVTGISNTMPIRKTVKPGSRRVGLNPVIKKTVIIDFPTPQKRPSEKTGKQISNRQAGKKRIEAKRKRKQEKIERQRRAEAALKSAQSRRKRRKQGY